jgi:hypothetical protein
VVGRQPEVLASAHTVDPVLQLAGDVAARPALVQITAVDGLLDPQRDPAHLPDLHQQLPTGTRGGLLPLLPLLLLFLLLALVLLADVAAARGRGGEGRKSDSAFGAAVDLVAHKPGHGHQLHQALQMGRVQQAAAVGHLLGVDGVHLLAEAQHLMRHPPHTTPPTSRRRRRRR